MKHLIKKTVVSIVATSVILTSFAASAIEESESKVLTPTEQVTEKTTSETTVETTKPGAQEVTAEKDKAVEKDLEAKDATVKKTHEDDDEISICIGNCDGEKHQSHSCDDDDGDCEQVHRFFHNRRDGFYVDVSAVSSVGDDYAFAEHVDTESEFDVAISYRVQLLGLFMESPGISTRRIQGMYSMPAWGVNFYNSDDYSFDLFYQYSTRGIEGLEGIQTRNEDERAGLRMTGFYENSQLQMIYSPVSRNGEGSDGIEASISYSYNLQFRNINFYTNLGLQYRSKEVTPYGVTTWLEDDLSTNAGISYSAEVGVEYPLTTDWVIGSYVGYNALSDRSIAARQDTVEDGYRAGLLLTFVF
ncbi:MipA/OmpV family protein [Colwellia piezophila]|uniref:MipA/OmpV family protein n=1 Tax=Colwellia piezophila TaxID=211668 RepID=UPI0003715F7B|nr:MipA/OmpV family protein [Colwellia piezophila]